MQTTKPMNPMGRTVFSDSDHGGSVAAKCALHFSVSYGEQMFKIVKKDREE